MENNNNNKPRKEHSHGAEILGTLIFTALIFLLMWGASIWMK